ncbi:E3 ubiquitin-protein ligase MBR2-like [Salvia splendens]|nr:E3 ubiquitin-protein ligase MBR2-like [Salvia splendens]XP_041994606.1 E3 ubiquitin-protein ligase MBR2-like [Salvia splendens]XP_041994607.1 E3 ubiquitin-protein ligase MBR2-like [Salvia splendens]XP_041994609.1 E3 ubiquitin-protein ligase MBR2-like [Salvia splendens]
MNGYSSKRGVATSRAPRKGVSSSSAQDQNVQFCNRIGCSGKIKYGNQNTKIRSSDNGKSPKSSFCSSDGNGAVEALSKSGSVVIREKASYLDTKKRLAFDQPESSQSGDSEASQSTSSPGRSLAAHNSGSASKSGQNPVARNGSGSVPSSVRTRKKVQNTSGSNKQNTQTASAVSPTTNRGNNRSRCLKNLKCNVVSDAVPPTCSSSGSKSPCKNVTRKRSLEGVSSEPGRGRQTVVSTHASSSSSSASVSASGADSTTSGSVRTGGSGNVNKSRSTRLSSRQNGRNTSSLRESSLRISHPEPPRSTGRPRLSQQYSPNAPSSGLSSYSLSPSSNSDGNRSTLMPDSVMGHGYSHFVNRDMLQRYNMDGIAEVLLALERFEQDEEMTHEQILSLETSLFLSGLNLYDQHRDMRLDIDDMSYEELLALGDSMGTVSTALSENELYKCIKRHVHQGALTEKESGKDGDDVKCSICQEEYVKGDAIGELVKCEHAYHIACISQWLRLKNWCPICKSAAAPSQTSSSSSPLS